MNREIPSFLLQTGQTYSASEPKTGRLRITFIDRTIKKSAYFVRESIAQYESSKQLKVFHNTSAQMILLSYLIQIVCISLTHSTSGQLLYTGILLFILLITSVRLLRIYKKVFILSFFFGFLIMFPASLNIFTPGKLLFTFLHFSSEKSFLIYHLPQSIGLTREGILIVLRMFLKVFNSLTLTFLILHCTSFNRLIKALKIIRVPGLFIVIITLSYKFIFVMAHTIEEMYQAIRSRWIGMYNQNETRNIIAGRMGFLFRKSWTRYEELYRAMVSRGFTGDINITGTEVMTLKEGAFLLVLICLGIFIILIGR